MAKSKEKPLDRYPYMENNLKGWDNWFVTNEVYAVNQNIIHNRLDYLQEEIDNIEQHGYVTDEEFNEYKTEVTGNFTTINEQITSINTRLNNLPNIYVSITDFNDYKTEVADDFNELETKIENQKPIRLTIRLNNLVPDTSISGYNYKKTVTVPGITADYYGYAWMEYGNYQLPFIVETGTDTVTLYLQIAPSTTTRIVVVLTNTKEVT